MQHNTLTDKKQIETNMQNRDREQTHTSIQNKDEDPDLRHLHQNPEISVDQDIDKIECMFARNNQTEPV